MWTSQIITIEDHLCTSGSRDSESASHLFLQCNFFGSIWLLVRAWLGFSSVNPLDFRDHLVQFTFGGGSKV